MTNHNSKHSNEQPEDWAIFTLSELSASQKFQLKHFCKQHKQSTPQTNEIVPVLFKAQSLVGFLRLIPATANAADAKTTDYLLRGLFIAPSHRHQGFARLLVQKTEKYLKRGNTITLFALEHLQNFYRSEDYRPVAVETLSPEFQKLWLKAHQEGKDWVLMQKTVV